LLAVFVQWLPAGLGFQTLSAPVASVLGGLLAGAGMLMLFRHHASLGGFNVTALMLQDRLGWRAGWVQLAMDAAVLVAALAIATPERVGWSVVAALATNLALAINHRPGRYSVA